MLGSVMSLLINTFGKFIVLLYIAGLMAVMNAVNLVFRAARIQMRKRRKRSQRPG